MERLHGFKDYSRRWWLTRLPAATQAASGKLLAPTGGFTLYLRKRKSWAHCWRPAGAGICQGSGSWPFPYPVLPIMASKTKTEVKGQRLVVFKNSIICSLGVLSCFNNHYKGPCSLESTIFNLVLDKFLLKGTSMYVASFEINWKHPKVSLPGLVSQRADTPFGFIFFLEPKTL